MFAKEVGKFKKQVLITCSSAAEFQRNNVCVHVVRVYIALCRRARAAAKCKTSDPTGVLIVCITSLVDQP